MTGCDGMEKLTIERKKIMEIENKKIDMENNYLDNVTYVPPHVNGNAGHKDCRQGVIVDMSESLNIAIVNVLYCKDRTVQATNPKDLVWG
jgi:hypothetical protein